jgi:sugar phosphate isomerase/epimerase
LLKKFEKLSVFQGRHVPEGKKKIQIYPKKKWVKDLNLIKQNNLKYFHWIVDNQITSNVLFTQKNKVKRIIKNLGIKILAICCDYFMSNPIINNEKKTIVIINKLEKICRFFGIMFIEIPFFKKNKINNKKEIDKIASFFNFIFERKRYKNIYFCLESDLNLKNYIYFINKIKKKKYIKIIYDTGNSYKIDKNKNFFNEAKKLKRYLKFIHIKDASNSKNTVRLGYGKVKFKMILKILNKINFREFIVLQTARAKNDVKEIQRNIIFLKKIGFAL